MQAPAGACPAFRAFAFSCIRDMGQKRDRVNGALKKAFAEKNGKSLRWAQIEAAKDSPAWRAFLAAQFPPSSAEAAGGGGEGAPMGGASDLARAGEAKESAWQILKRMETQLETAARSGDVGLIASFTRAVREARANWERAGLHEQRLQEAAGSLVPRVSRDADAGRCAAGGADGAAEGFYRFPAGGGRAAAFL